MREGLQFQIEDILVNGPPWNTRVAVRAYVFLAGSDGDEYNNRLVVVLEPDGAGFSAGRTTRTRSEWQRWTRSAD